MNIILGVSGGIAAYKAVNIASSLRGRGCEVQTVMTANAQKIIAPTAFEALTKRSVACDMWEKNINLNVEHIAFAEWADALLIAPATYNIVGKIANGIADDMLSTVVSAFDKPVCFALAMNKVMYANPILKNNIERLQALGYFFIESDEGLLATRISGKGRLKPEEEIVELFLGYVKTPKILQGARVLVTAGRTEEPLDPVRFLTNRSSGIMGYSLAAVARDMGAHVTLVSGAADLPPPAGVQLVRALTAQSMYAAVGELAPKQNIIIGSAAVADYRPEFASEQKIKKQGDLTLKLIKNPDIMQHLGSRKAKGQVLVGFALETENLLQNAAKKLAGKNLDFIVANGPESFNAQESQAVLLGDKIKKELPRLAKKELAEKILQEAAALLAKK